MLVFLGGMSDLTAVAAAARDYALSSKAWIVLLLHSALDAQEQDLVFHAAPPGVRKCVLSTNIAEVGATRRVCHSSAVCSRGINRWPSPRCLPAAHHSCVAWSNRFFFCVFSFHTCPAFASCMLLTR